MGNQVQIGKTHKKSKMLFDERFGGHVTLEFQNNQIHLIKAIHLFKEQLNSTLDLITNRSKLIHKYFSSIKNHCLHKQKDLCSEVITLDLAFQYYQNDLQKQIIRRRTKNNYFTEEEVCRKIYQICDCLNFLEKRKCFHGDIKSSTIFLDRKNNVKLHDSYFSHRGQTNLEFMISNPNVFAYLSPLQLSILISGGYLDQQQNQTYKNQIFSLGMTILEMMLLKSSYDCFDKLAKLIKIQILNSKLDKASQNYSQKLIDLVREMVSLQSNKRPNYSQILNNPLIKSFGTNRYSVLSQFGRSSQVEMQRQYSISTSHLKKTKQYSCRSQSSSNYYQKII